MRYVTVVASSLGVLVLAISTVADAQTLALRTWVSGTGSDANMCTRTSPCASFQGALNKTAAGGEIDAVDAGSFGAVTISKSIIIDGKGALAGILATGGANAIDVSAGDNDIVVLRNLDIDGAGTGFEGIHLSNAKQLVIENTRIYGFNSNAILVTAPLAGPQGGARNLVIRNSSVLATPLVGNGESAGLRIRAGITTISHSVIGGNHYGLLAEVAGVINADNNVLTGNAVAVIAGNGGTVRLSNNEVYGNLTGFGCGGGVLASAGNNRKGSNTGGTAAACSPTVTITQQ